jgi:integrase/recombinase XerD
VGVHRRGLGIEFGAGSAAAVTGELLRAVAGHGVHVSGGHLLAVEGAGGGGDHPDPLVPDVGEQQVPGGVYRRAVRVFDLGAGGGAAKKQDHPAISHLTVEQTRRLLAQPDRSTRQGRRDATLLATLYDTGARVQELAALAVRDIRLQNPAMASLTGKGRKTRHVPLAVNTITLLAAYLAEHRLDEPGHDDHPVFFNQHRAKLSRGGIAWIIRKYQAQIHDRLLAGASISPHTLRHSKAMHLYEAGVPLPYIRYILGHVDLSTTEIYARASTEAKRKALEAAYQGIVTSDLPEWNQDPGLLDRLTSL